MVDDWSSSFSRDEQTPHRDGGEGDASIDYYKSARNIALRQLAMAPRSKKQLFDKMAQRNVPDDVAIAVLDRLEQVGLVDDEAFAQTFARSKQHLNGLSRRSLAHKLRTAGVNKETITSVLETHEELENDIDVARRLALKKARSSSGLEPQIRKRRLVGALARKGFSASVCYQVADEVLNNDTSGNNRVIDEFYD